MPNGVSSLNRTPLSLLYLIPMKTWNENSFVQEPTDNGDVQRKTKIDILKTYYYVYI